MSLVFNLLVLVISIQFIQIYTLVLPIISDDYVDRAFFPDEIYNNNRYDKFKTDLVHAAKMFARRFFPLLKLNVNFDKNPILIKFNQTALLINETNQYFDVDREIPVVIKPSNLLSTSSCHSERRTRSKHAAYRKFDFKFSLKEGGDSQVYVVERFHQNFVLKVYTRASKFILQLNALLAYGTFFNTLRLLEITESTTKSHFKFYERERFIDGQGSYCLLMDDIRGRNLSVIRKNSRSSFFLHPNDKDVFKKSIRFIILVLKQLQVLHFTFNHFAIMEEKLLQPLTYTTYHGQVSESNIIVTPLSDYGNEFPHLIDFGHKIVQMMNTPYDVFLLIYNRHLLKDRLPTSKRVLGRWTVHKNQLMSSPQIVDLCTFWIMIIREVVGPLEKSKSEMGICYYMIHLIRNPMYYDRVKRALYDKMSKTIHWPILGQLAQILRNVQTYESLWLRIHKLFSMDT
ncbi:hypothetical protein SNEBB_002815 [Seison nebaliae]|nr:hypothetical protein SNEBB_002815 [Seison nebaliae]